nr:hypothetical protein CFP56_40250 [Quercus suber]
MRFSSFIYAVSKSRLIGSIMLDGACPSSCYERSHKGLLVAEALILFLEECTSSCLPLYFCISREPDINL